MGMTYLSAELSKEDFLPLQPSTNVLGKYTVCFFLLVVEITKSSKITASSAYNIGLIYSPSTLVDGCKGEKSTSLDLNKCCFSTKVSRSHKSVQDLFLMFSVIKQLMNLVK